jgi:hypothetical protein
MAARSSFGDVRVGGLTPLAWYKIVELVTLAALVVGVMMRAGWLARVRVLGIDIGGSQEPDEDGDAGPDGSRRETWWYIGAQLLLIATFANLLTGDRTAGGWIAAAMVVYVVGTGMVRWLRRRGQRRTSRAT